MSSEPNPSQTDGRQHPGEKRNSVGCFGRVILAVVVLLLSVVVVRQTFGWIGAPIETANEIDFDESTTTIPLLVAHPQCSNSYSPDGPVRLDISETATEVRIQAEVKRQWLLTGCADSFEPIAVNAELEAPLAERTLLVVQP